MIEVNKIINSDCVTGLLHIPDDSIDCCVTSPPYFGLRDYGHHGQIGLEGTPELYVKKLVGVFNDVKRVLKKEGTLWLNLGDSYAGGGFGAANYPATNDNWKQSTSKGTLTKGLKGFKGDGYKQKDLIGIPWMVAFALRSAGWYLRQDIIWHKPNPMPESVTDRCTKAHEYIFLLSKSVKYYYDADSIKSYSKDPQDDLRRFEEQTWDHKNTPDKLKNGIRPRKISSFGNRNGQLDRLHSGNDYFGLEKANKRSVWSVTNQPFPEAHFATFPEDLIVDCIKAGCPEDGVVLDPFMGAGTTALVASKLNRNYIGFELNAEYIKIANKRLQDELGMFNKAS